MPGERVSCTSCTSTNLAPWPIDLVGIDVFGEGTDPLASYRGETLEKMAVPVENVLRSVEPPAPVGTARTLGEGRGMIVFFGLTVNASSPAPAQLRHRFSFSVAGDSGGTIERTLDAPIVDVNQKPAPVLRAPLRGTSWVAINALALYDHRRAFVVVDGKLKIAQRFAIDWLRLGPDGRRFREDTKSNANFYAYGAEVFAVANGRVVDARDGIADNSGSSDRSSRVITLDNVAGNHLILDLGQGRFALYAHLQPGSLRVKLGDDVKAGQVLALLGNSGNSDEPHLHFQIMDANSALGAEGAPYELDTFTQLGIMNPSEVLDAGHAWKPVAAEKPVVHSHEFRRQLCPDPTLSTLRREPGHLRAHDSRLTTRGQGLADQTLRPTATRTPYLLSLDGATSSGSTAVPKRSLSAALDSAR